MDPTYQIENNYHKQARNKKIKKGNKAKEQDIKDWKMILGKDLLLENQIEKLDFYLNSGFKPTTNDKK